MTAEPLEDALAAYRSAPLPDDDNVRAAYTVVNDAHATELMRRRWWIEKRRNKRAAIAAQEVADLEAQIRVVREWLAGVDERDARDAEWLDVVLTDYALHRRSATGGRVKSLDTPFGRVTTRDAGDGVDVADEAAFVAWAKSATGVRFLTFPDPKVKRSELRTLRPEDDGTVVDPLTGEVVPGLKGRPGGVTARVTLAAGRAPADDDPVDHATPLGDIADT